MDLDSPGGAVKAYQAVLSEGSARDQVAPEPWSSARGLAGPRSPNRVRVLWEEQFPALRRGPV